MNSQTLYSWRHRWKQEGKLVPATSKAPEQWSPADKLAAVIQAAGLSGAGLGAYCRERGLFPKQLARWRQVAEDTNNQSAPSMNVFQVPLWQPDVYLNLTSVSIKSLTTGIKWK